MYTRALFVPLFSIILYFLAAYCTLDIILQTKGAAAAAAVAAKLVRSTLGYFNVQVEKGHEHFVP